MWSVLTETPCIYMVDIFKVIKARCTSYHLHATTHHITNVNESVQPQAPLEKSQTNATKATLQSTKPTAPDSSNKTTQQTKQIQKKRRKRNMPRIIYGLIELFSPSSLRCETVSSFSCKLISKTVPQT